MSVCRSYRLHITAVKEPASANSVQLARLDLYTCLDTSTQPPSLLCEAVTALKAVLAQAADHDPDSESAASQAMNTLLLLLANVAQHPSESKFRTLKLENTKVKAMLSVGPEVDRLLRAAGEAVHGTTWHGHLCGGRAVAVFALCIRMPDAWARLCIEQAAVYSPYSAHAYLHLCSMID